MLVVVRVSRKIADNKIYSREDAGKFLDTMDTGKLGHCGVCFRLCELVMSG